MIDCLICGKKPASSSIALCVDCVREFPDRAKLLKLHEPIRRKFGLPLTAPAQRDGLSCKLCLNRCRIGEGEVGYCGLRAHREGQLVEKMEHGSALVHAYLDRLPTNCCASWFCKGAHEDGYNLAVFFYGCSFDCLYCQNSSHKLLSNAPSMTEDDLVQKALEKQIRCVCFFGGSPEPQLPFALRVARRLCTESGGTKHICWEWNGSGNPAFVKRAMQTAQLSGGTVKFDLKAYDPNLHAALCGVEKDQTYRNFMLAAELCAGDENVLTATTLLVSHYVDEQEVGQIAAYISDLNPRIPYSLLVFHPDFYMDDLPVTPRKQVLDCYDAASAYLERVNIGNRQLL